ncbi:UbiA family prenyltransferase [Streptomyces sp. NPDC016459]|uniref:UbiA family prenyltransferase n=1 Tax=Streptomyces sp. NPDC016459 TaxID=3157190 RepID=UPI0033FC4AF2
MTGSPFSRRLPGAVGTLRAWGELLRVSALLSVPGDALAGAAAAGVRPGRGTAWAIGASLCLYEAGMALNDWADRDVDAVERPHRPLPSGRVAPGAALGAAGALTVTGLALASRAGRPALAVASALAATVWAYDLRLKHTAAGPAAMATARGLDLLLGALAAVPAGGVRESPPMTPGAPGRRTVTSATASGSRTRIRAADRRTGISATAAGSRTGIRAADRRTVTSATAAGSSAGTSGTAADRRTRISSADRRTGIGAVVAGSRTGTSLAAVVAGSRTGTSLAATATATAPASRTATTALRAAAPAAATLAAHTYAVTAVSRHEAHGGSTAVPLGALATTALLSLLTAETGPTRTDARTRPTASTRSGSRRWPPTGTRPGARSRTGPRLRTGAPTPPPAAAHDLLGRAMADRITLLLAAAYLRTAARPLLDAALNPSPHLTQRAVGGGIRAMIPLQAALAARSGAPVAGLALLGLAPAARRLARRISPT